jgi:hypothetical protein
MQQQYYPQKPKFWTKGKIAVVLVVLIVTVIAVAGVMQQMPYLQEGSSIIIGFEQVMYKAGDNNTVVPGSNMLVFPYSTLQCQTNKSCIPASFGEK